MHFDTVDQFLPYFDNIRARTDRVIAAVPDDKYDWTYREGKFTIADLIRHLAATERWMFAENVAGRPSCYPGHGAELAASPQEVRDYLVRMHAEAKDIFAGLTPDDLQVHCETPGGAQITAWKWLRAMIEHEVHHRGQIYLYLGMLDLPSPPLYGLTSEEVKERSIGFDG